LGTAGSSFTNYWLRRAIHVASDSLFRQTIFDALFQLVPNTLGAAAKRIQRNAQGLRQRQAVIDLRPLFISVILQDQPPVVVFQFAKTLVETFLARVLRQGFWRGQLRRKNFFQTGVAAFPAFQLFQKDHSRHAVAPSGNVANGFALIKLADDAVERFIGVFFRMGMRLASRRI
jgi:hypothetical protein